MKDPFELMKQKEKARKEAVLALFLGKPKVSALLKPPKDIKKKK